MVGAEDVKEAHVEVVKVWFNGGSLHDQVLCHPGIVLFPNQAAEFLHLENEKAKKRRKKDGGGEEEEEGGGEGGRLRLRTRVTYLLLEVSG